MPAKNPDPQRREVSAPHNRRSTRHDDAIIQAEVHRLAGALAPFRILHHDTLKRLARGGSWRDDGFEVALAAAVREGVVDPLPGNFYRDATRSDRQGHPNGAPQPSPGT